MAVSLCVRLPDGLIGKYPSAKLPDVVEEWCKKRFQSPFNVGWCKEWKHHNSYLYWTPAPAIRGSLADITVFRLMFGGMDASAITKAARDARYEDDPVWGSW